MSTLQEIKDAIPKLTVEERAEVARCLNAWQDDEWDEQMNRDFKEGKFWGKLTEKSLGAISPISRDVKGHR